MLRHAADGYVLLCGDLNGRLGVGTEWVDVEDVIDLASDDEDDLVDMAQEQLKQWPRESDDTVVAGHAPAIRELCRTAGLAVLNGRFGCDSAAHTCVRTAGQSVVDYILLDARAMDVVQTMRVDQSSDWLDKSDHRPVWTGLAAKQGATLAEVQQQTRRLDRMARRADGWVDEEHDETDTVRIVASEGKLPIYHVRLLEEVERQEQDWREARLAVQWSREAFSGAVVKAARAVGMEQKVGGRRRADWCAAGGHEARKEWWDTECSAAQRHVRQAETDCNAQQRRSGGQATDELLAARKRRAAARRRVKQLMRNKERQARTRRRDELLRLKNARKFFRVLKRYDMQEQETGGDVPLEVFRQYFEQLAKPPVCGWFDVQHAVRIKQQLLAWDYRTAATLWDPPRTLYNTRPTGSAEVDEYGEEGGVACGGEGVGLGLHTRRAAGLCQPHGAVEGARGGRGAIGVLGAAWGQTGLGGA